MNSFRAVERAMTYEAQRQFQIWQETGKRLGEVPKSTYGWDETTQTTYLQREKEESSDYRYFPEPDLVPVTTTDAQVEHIRASLGELPAALRCRLEETYGITPYDSDVLVNQGRAAIGLLLSNWRGSCPTESLPPIGSSRTMLRTLHQRAAGHASSSSPCGQGNLAELIETVRQGRLTTSRAREVFAELLAGCKPLDETMKSMGIAAVDESEVENLCRELLAANPKVVAEVKEGKPKGLGQLIGQAKKKNPNINPNRFRELCTKLIEGAELMPIITLTTDFGTGSPYVAVMKAVILSDNPVATIVDISHAISRPGTLPTGPWSWTIPRPGSPTTRSTWPSLTPASAPRGRSSTPASAAQQYIAPDNGLLARLMARMQPAAAGLAADGEGTLAAGGFAHLPRTGHHGTGCGPLEPGSRSAAARTGRGAPRSTRIARTASCRHEDPRRSYRDRFVRQPDHEYLA